MDFQYVWSNDYLAFAFFLGLIVPVPFIYSVLRQGSPSINGFDLTVRAFLYDFVFWFLIYTGYYFLFGRGGEEEDVQDFEK